MAGERGCTWDLFEQNARDNGMFKYSLLQGIRGSVYNHNSFSK